MRKVAPTAAQEQRRPTLQVTESPAQSNSNQKNYPGVPLSLEKPALTAPEAQPTPTRPQALPMDLSHETASFSPSKSRQFSPLKTPQQRRQNADSSTNLNRLHRTCNF